MELADLNRLWSHRDLDRIKRRLLHYSAAVRHLRIRVTEMQGLMGPVLKDEYDFPKRPPAGLADLALDMAGVIRRYGPLGAPLWPPVASSAYGAMLSGEERNLFRALTWDASPVGWAGLTRWWELHGAKPTLRELLMVTVGSWPTGWDVSEQPFREALGGVLAFEEFAQSVQIGAGLSCIMRNDAAAAIAAFRKGS